MPQNALKYDIEVMEKGHVELQVPFLPGSQVTVFVIEKSNDVFNDLLEASQSNLDFWDNPFDDEDWNTSCQRVVCSESFRKGNKNNTCDNSHF